MQGEGAQGRQRDSGLGTRAQALARSLEQSYRMGPPCPGGLCTVRVAGPGHLCCGLSTWPVFQSRHVSCRL